MSSRKAPIDTLPNEILNSVLSFLETRQLTELASVSRQMRLLASRIIYHRLTQIAPLPDGRIILECYHPSEKLSTPTLACTYQKTIVRDSPGFDPESPSLADLGQVYFSYRPVISEETHLRRRRSALLRDDDDDDDDDGDAPTQMVNLEEGELFSQLCAATSLVKEGPRRGLFVSHVNVVDGVVRVFRNWLANMAGRPHAVHEQDRFLWSDQSHSVGIRFRVDPGASSTMPLLSGPDDTPPVSYALVYEELLVRGYNLLDAVERSASQEVAHSGNTLVLHATASV